MEIQLRGTTQHTFCHFSHHIFSPSQAVREHVADVQDRFKFTTLNEIIVKRAKVDLMQLVNSDARVMLLYCTKDEANEILAVANELHLTEENFVWVVTQSVIENAQPKSSFPPGMLGVHFDTSSAGLLNEISTALKVYALGVENFITDPTNKGYKLNTHGLSCEGEGRGRWDTGEIFYRYLRNVSLEGENSKPNTEFTTGMFSVFFFFPSCSGFTRHYSLFDFFFVLKNRQMATSNQLN